MARNLDAYTDEELLIRCRRARSDTAREIIGLIASRHEGALVGYLEKMVGMREAAEDLFQETMLRLFRNRRRYKTVAKCSTWIYRIGTNLALNYIRDNRRRTGLSLNAPADEDGREFSALFPSKEKPPDATAADRDTDKLVRAIIGRIPEKYRSVLLLCDLRDMSYGECAETLDIAVGTVRSRLSRAREQFIRLFEPHIEELETK